MYIRRDLQWMHGFCHRPGHWLALPAGANACEIVLDRNLLRRATRTINLLRREFPRALPRVVGDTIRWAEAHRSLLDVLKPAIHDGAGLPRSPTDLHPHATPALRRSVRRLRDRHRHLVPLIRALEWQHWTDLHAFTLALRWCEREHGLLGVLVRQLGHEANALAIRLWQLESQSPRRSDKLHGLLASAAIWSVPLEADDKFLDTMTKSCADRDTPVPTRPAAGLAATVVDWVHWLATKERACQRRGLQWFALIVDLDHVADWQRWWTRLYDIHEHSVRLSRQARRDRVDPASTKRLGSQLRTHGKRRPPALPHALLGQLLTTVPDAPCEPLFRALRRWLKDCPATIDGALAPLQASRQLLKFWRSSTRWHDREDDAVRRDRIVLINRLGAFFRSHQFETRVIEPWLDVFTGAPSDHGNNRLIFDLDRELQVRRKLETFFDLLATRNATERDSVLLLARLTSELNPRQAAAAFDHWGQLPRDRYVWAPVLHLACDLTQDHPALFAQVYAAVNDLDDGAWSAQELLPVAMAAFDRAGARVVFLDAIIAGHLSRLVSSAVQLKFLKTQRIPIPRVWRAGAAGHAWPDRFPAGLYASLARLARYDADAGRTAGRLLARDFPDPVALQTEMDRLAAMPSPSAAQSKRLATLTKRWHKPTAVSPKRLDNLARKIENTAVRRAVMHWATRIEQRFVLALRRFLQCEALPDWCQRPDVSRALAGIADLEPPAAALAQTILTGRIAAPPWNLQTHVANVRFLGQMKQLDLDLSPWIETGFARTARTKDGVALTLAIERDPLEILNMGTHFNTCLSPGEINFFSVFSNISDLNKQVVYARDGEGRVFGRMLLALTDAGGLLHFHPYAHAQSTGFVDIAARFAGDLATEMGTLVVARGNVPTLVSRSWYDDGPVDNASAHPALAEGSVFRASLASLPGGRFVAALDEQLAPQGLNGLTLPLVIQLAELDDLPELTRALLPSALGTNLPWPSLQRLAGLVLPGLGGRDKQALLEHIYRSAMATHDYGSLFFDEAAIDLLLEYAPALCLRLLRRTRPKGVRKWTDEWIAARIYYAAGAHEALHRPTRALELYRLGQQKALDRDSRQRCGKAARRLRARPGMW